MIMQTVMEKTLSKKPLTACQNGCRALLSGSEMLFLLCGKHMASISTRNIMMVMSQRMTKRQRRKYPRTTLMEIRRGHMESCDHAEFWRCFVLLEQSRERNMLILAVVLARLLHLLG